MLKVNLLNWQRLLDFHLIGFNIIIIHQVYKTSCFKDFPQIEITIIEKKVQAYHRDPFFKQWKYMVIISLPHQKKSLLNYCLCQSVSVQGY